jgi:hypothetical protein
MTVTDDNLRRAFEQTHEDVVDAGFARRVVAKVNGLRRRRRLVLGAAAAMGTFITVPALLRAHEFIVPLTWPAHAAGQLVGVIALSAAAIAIWLFSLTAEG